MRVLVFGGTHGNEWTGVMAVSKYAQQFKQKYASLDLHFVLANPEAHRINRRFKDEDLNRAFQYLNEERRDSYEHQRAREIKEMIKASPCFVIDLHTTTSNMGATVILAHENPLNFKIAHGLIQSTPECRVILSPDPTRKYLASQSNHGMMIEVGPVANGVVRAQALESTLKILDGILTGLLRKDENLTSNQLEVYQEVEDLKYPLDKEGRVSAYIHPSFQDQDFSPINGSYTPFKAFTGEDIALTTKEELYPIFINEAAYYPTKLAFTLCRKINKTY